MRYLLGVDIGTTGTKTVAFDEEGNMLSSAYQGYEVVSEQADWAEQDADDWWRAVVRTVREAVATLPDKNGVVALALSSQGGSLVMADKSGQPLGRAVSWLDHRPGDKELDALCAGKETDYHYLRTGWPLKNCFNLAQCKWMQNNRADLFKRTDKFLSTSDYLNLKLAGRAVTDFTSAGITNMEDLRTKTWDEAVFGDLEIGRHQLGELNAPGTPIGTLTKEAADELGLPETVLVVNGGMDQYCGALGAGVVEDGDLMLATGTAWVLLGAYPQLVFDQESYFAPCPHILPEKYGIMATVPTGGIAMEWFRKTFSDSGAAERESFAHIDEAAARRPEGGGGLLFYPHFSGSTCPTWSSESRAAFLGINLSHERADFARAVMEGVTFELSGIIAAMRRSGGKTRQIRMIGGAAKSKLWRGIVADITGLPVVRSQISDAACAGAAMAAGVGAGVYGDYQQASALFCKPGETILPDSEKHAVYQDLLQDYQSGFQHLRSFYQRTR